MSSFRSAALSFSLAALFAGGERCARTTLFYVSFRISNILVAVAASSYDRFIKVSNLVFHTLNYFTSAGTNKIVEFHESEQNVAFILGVLLYSSADSAMPAVIPKEESTGGCSV